MPIQVAESKTSKRGPKVLSHLEIHPQLGGGHIVKHVYEGLQHEPRQYQFGEEEGDRIASHISRHAGLPMQTGMSALHSGRPQNEKESETESEIDEKPVKERRGSVSAGSSGRRAVRKHKGEAAVTGFSSRHENARYSEE